jgi:hypothetical protein
MATNFPASLDTLTNPSATDTLDSPPHDEQHADANDAIEALQAKVGVDGSAVTTSLDYKVANLESRPVETKTASYTLVAGDVNKRIVMNNAGATTITVNDGVFAAGDSVWIHNIGAGTTTVTAGTATVNTAGSLDVGQWEGGSLYFTSASSAIFFRGGGAVSSANFTDTATGTYSSGGKNYKYLTFTASGTLTVDTAGIADILVVGGGGASGGSVSSGRCGGGGGAGGFAYLTSAYLTVGTLTVTIGAGGAGGANDGTDGTHSRLDQYATGGGGGGSQNSASQGHNGISGGGGGDGSRLKGLSVNTYRGNDGADGGGSGTAGGGGGSSAAASTSTGGAGTSNSITNSAVTYAAGGDGGTTGSGASVPGAANTGDGATGPGTTGNGANGGSGVVIVRVEV